MLRVSGVLRECGKQMWRGCVGKCVGAQGLRIHPVPSKTACRRCGGRSAGPGSCFCAAGVVSLGPAARGVRGGGGAGAGRGCATSGSPSGSGGGGAAAASAAAVAGAATAFGGRRGALTAACWVSSCHPSLKLFNTHRCVQERPRLPQQGSPPAFQLDRHECDSNGAVGRCVGARVAPGQCSIY